MSAALTPPTPENVAEFFAYVADDCDDDGGSLWLPSITAKDNVIEIAIKPCDEDGNALDEPAHFRAVVVEGETVPLILNRERYADEVASLVEQLVRALAHAPREDYPIHVAQLRGSLLALADEYEADAAADQGEAKTAGDGRA